MHNGLYQKKISVIIPIYNVSEYLRYSVDSVLRQSYTNLEIILIDDGSTDGCSKICDEYAANDKRVVVVHKTYGGVSDARNAGLDVVTGDYIVFVDSDDYVGPSYIERLYQTLITNNADISACDYARVGQYENDRKESLGKKRIIFSNVEALKETYHPKTHGMEFLLWGRLYKAQLFTDYNIRFPNGKLHEDMFTMYQLLYFSKRYAYADDVTYFYRKRPGSIMTNAYTLARSVAVEATREACGFFLEKKEKELFNYAVNAHFRMSVSVYCKMMNLYTESDRRLQIGKILKNFRIDVFQYSKYAQISVKKKMFYWFFAIFPFPSLAKFVLK